MAAKSRRPPTPEKIPYFATKSPTAREDTARGHDPATAPPVSLYARRLPLLGESSLEVRDERFKQPYVARAYVACRLLAAVNLEHERRHPKLHVFFPVQTKGFFPVQTKGQALRHHRGV